MKDKTIPKLRQDWFLAEFKRLKLDRPVAQLVDKTGFSKGQISKILNDKQYPTPEFLDKFCESFRIDPKKLETYIDNHIDKEAPAEEIEAPTDDLKSIVLLMANNVNTLYATVKEDREAMNMRLQKVELSSEELYSKVKSLSEFDRQTVHRLEQIEGRLAKLIMTDPNSGAAVLGKKRRN